MAEADVIDVNRQIEKKPRVADYVVDADVHVTPPPTFWADYLSPQFRDLAPKVESGDVAAVRTMLSSSGADNPRINGPPWQVHWAITRARNSPPR